MSSMDLLWAESTKLVFVLGISLLLHVVVFMYFKSRMDETENRVNAMFSVIQQHTRQQNQQYQYNQPDVSESVNTPNYDNDRINNDTSNQQEDELIHVSDDSQSEDDSDSDSDSDVMDSDNEDDKDQSENNDDLEEVTDIDKACNLVFTNLISLFMTVSNCIFSFLSN